MFSIYSWCKPGSFLALLHSVIFLISSPFFSFTCYGGRKTGQHEQGSSMAANFLFLLTLFSATENSGKYVSTWRLMAGITRQRERYRDLKSKNGCGLCCSTNWGLIKYCLSIQNSNIQIIGLQAESPMSRARAGKSKVIRWEGVWWRGANTEGFATQFCARRMRL